jgi:hypothetical protein
MSAPRAVGLLGGGVIGGGWAARPSDGRRVRVTRTLGPQTLTIAIGRWVASKTAAETPFE